MKRLRILVWHIHGSYLNYLVQAPHEFYLPVKPGRPEGYGGKGATFVWPAGTHEVAAEDVKNVELDLVIHQSPKNFFEDQYEILSEEQRRLPRIYLEHNTPKEHPTDSRHPIDDPAVLLVHCTHFNHLMWDSGRTPTMVVEHGVLVPDEVCYRGEKAKGVVVVNGLKRRDRIAGFDVWQKIKQEVPLDLIGMDSAELGGLGDIPHVKLLDVEANYRFFFNPIRYTSLPLALLEAMAIGMPIVALATTEVPTVLQNGVAGFVSNDLDYLVDRMVWLLENPDEARAMGENARRIARARFSIERFTRDWERAFQQAIGVERSVAIG